MTQGARGGRLDDDARSGAEGYRCKTFTIPEDVYITEFGGDAAGRGRAATPRCAGLPEPAPVQCRTNRCAIAAACGSGRSRLKTWSWRLKTCPPARSSSTSASGRSTQRGVCTLRSDATLFTANPHMHQTGVHMRATMRNGAGQERVRYDGDYEFEAQVTHDIGPFELKRGDQVTVECTYDNDTDRVLRWGDSSLDEMCSSACCCTRRSGTQRSLLFLSATTAERDHC